MKNLYVDMDGVLAYWNQDASIEEVASKGYFLNCAPVRNVIEAIRNLIEREDVNVTILSSVFNDDHSSEEKLKWLGKYSINAKTIFVPYGSSKSEYLQSEGMISKDDFLLDDFSKNLHQWHGIGIKMYNHCNGTKGTWHGYSVRNDMPADLLEKQLYGIMAVEV